MSSPIRILYVEDNDIVREVTAELLAQGDRQIDAVESAEEALKVFGAAKFDVVITDVSLPVMSGLNLARSLLNCTPGLPIIIASGYALDFGLENLGPSVRSIIKPFESAQMDALIKELLQP